jgi:hypothetical protein
MNRPVARWILRHYDPEIVGAKDAKLRRKDAKESKDKIGLFCVLCAPLRPLRPKQQRHTERLRPATPTQLYGDACEGEERDLVLTPCSKLLKGQMR